MTYVMAGLCPGHDCFWDPREACPLPRFALGNTA
jgi:hypothetical protein